MSVKHTSSGLFLKWQDFKKNRQGVAAVEFALVVPILLTLYIGSLELSMGLTVNKRIARVASTVADLVTQQEDVDKVKLHGIMGVAESVMYPYTTTKPEITIVAVDVDEDHDEWGKVVWSRGMDNGGNFTTGRVVGSDIRVPERLRFDDSFLIYVTAGIKYKPVVARFTGKDSSGNPTGVDIEEQYWLNPRLPIEIPCSNC
ncbi:MAG: TadE/TadG family type IV pilus assembly protein [Pseudomonadota bacterium]